MLVSFVCLCVMCLRVLRVMDDVLLYGLPFVLCLFICVLL